MSPDDRLTDILLHCEELAERGLQVDLAALCRDCPELQDELTRRWERLQGFNRILGGTAPVAGLPTIPGYQVVRELGRGGMGVVYEAVQVRLGRPVALKMLLSGSFAGSADLERFRREAEALGKLQHPNIVRVYEVGDHQGRPFFCMELLPGGTLETQTLGRPWLPQSAAALIETLARAVHTAHENGLVHRDLKPANILLDQSGTPRISDFGLVKHLDRAGPTPSSGAILGTPLYMAPEQASGKSRLVGPASDIYALGAILYELLTGRPPFVAATPMDVILQVLLDPPPSPSLLRPGLPADLATICLKCLEKDPGSRYSTALALAEDLQRFRNQEPILARPIGRVARFGRWCRRKPVVASLAALLVLTVTLGFAGITWKWLDADRQRQRAEENLALALQVNFAVGDLAAELKPLAGTQAHTVKRILRLAEQNYESILDRTGETPLLLEGKAKMRSEFVDVYLALNDSTQALANAQESVDLWRRLLARPGMTETRERGLTRALVWLGTVQRLRGDSTQALATLREAVELSAAWEWDEDHAAGLAGLAETLWVMDDRSSAETHFAQSLTIRSRLGDQGTRARLRLAQSKRKMAEVVAWKERYPEALALLRDSHQSMYTLLREEPGNSESVRQLWDTLSWTGRIHAWAGDATSAQRAFDEAIQLSERLTRDDPGNIRWQRFTLLARLDRAELLTDPDDLLIGDRLERRLRSYLTTLEQDCTLFRGLVVADPHNAEAEMNLAGRELNLARGRGLLGVIGVRPEVDAQLARKQYAVVGERLDRLARRDPDRPHFVAGALDVPLDLGCLLFAEGKQVEAVRAQLAASKQARDTYERIARHRPSDTRIQGEIATRELQMAIYHNHLVRLGEAPTDNASAALLILRSALTRFQQLSKQEPDYAHWLEQARTSHLLTAHLLRHLGKDAHAEQKSAQAVEARLTEVQGRAAQKPAEGKPAPVAQLSDLVRDKLYEQEGLWLARADLSAAAARYAKQQGIREAVAFLRQSAQTAEALLDMPSPRHRAEAEQVLARGQQVLAKLGTRPDLGAVAQQLEEASKRLKKQQ